MKFEQAIAFKRHLAAQDSQVTGGKLSRATLHSTLEHLRRFFQWLAGQPGYKARLRYADYGQVGSRRQGEIIRSLGEPRPAERSNAAAIAEAVVRKLERSGRIG